MMTNKVINAKDYHKILGISKKASKDEIKKAYRKLALRFHPDRNADPTAENKFKEINEAYRVLSGLEKAPVETSFGNSPMDEERAWAASVIKRWEDMLGQKQNNMYR